MTNQIVPLIGASALEFWLDYSKRKNPESFAYKLCERTSLPDDYNVKLNEAKACLIAQELGLELPLCIMRPTVRHRTCTAFYHMYAEHRHLPLNSFIKLKPSQLPAALSSFDIYVASPEHCFLSFASKLSFPRLVVLGCELCAHYVYDLKAPYLQAFREPVTSSYQIADYLKEANHNKGYARALRASKYICDGSNSIMESKLASICVLPFAEGGYNLLKPELNIKVFLKKNNDYFDRNYSMCDLVWKEERVIVEYDSTMTHLDKKQHIRDKKKANVLSGSGYTLINLTADDIKNFHSIEEAFAQIRMSLGMRSRNVIMKKHEMLRNEVVQDLFAASWKWF